MVHSKIAIRVGQESSTLVRWLRSCKNATVSRAHVTNYVLDFENLLEQVFNRNFHIVLPMSFKKIEVEPKFDTSNLSKRTPAGRNISNDPDPNPKKGKRKSEDGNDNLVSNSAQDEDFKVRAGKTWKDTFSKQLSLNRPFWDKASKVKICAR